jgi:hypothetical protein
LGQPLSLGNFIVFKGEKNLGILIRENNSNFIGKTSVAVNTISQFLQENENNRAVYVGLQKSTATKSFDSLADQIKNRVAVFTVGGQSTTISDAEYFLIPK